MPEGSFEEVKVGGLNGVNRFRQTGLKVNRLPSKKIILHRQPSIIQSDINRQNVSRYFKSHYFYKS